MPAEVIARICNLPKEFYKRDVSMLVLLNEIGIKRTPELLTSSAIGECLSRHEELVDDWLLWSSDKRSSSGWYFMKEGQGYIVGYYPDGEKLHFTDPLLACSEFVVREVQVLMRY